VERSGTGGVKPGGKAGVKCSAAIFAASMGGSAPRGTQRYGYAGCADVAWIRDTQECLFCCRG